MKRQVPVGLLYRWMYPTVNPYSGGLGVCSLGVIGRLAFFSNRHYSPPLLRYPAACCGPSFTRVLMTTPSRQARGPRGAQWTGPDVWLR